MYKYSNITHSYSEALFNTAKKMNLIFKILEDVSALIKVLNQSPRLVVFLEGPHIDNSEKHNLIDTVFKGNLPDILTNLIQLLIDNNRIEYLSEILEDYQKRVQYYKGLFPAMVITAQELSFTDKLKLKACLEKFTKKQLQITYNIKKKLIGGLIFKFEDTLIDYSLRGGLNRIRRELELASLP